MEKYIKSDKKSKYKMKKPDYSFSKKEAGLVAVLLALIILAAIYAFWVDNKDKERLGAITNFNECVAAGNPVLEVYPERCVANDEMFVKNY